MGDASTGPESVEAIEAEQEQLSFCGICEATLASLWRSTYRGCDLSSTLEPTAVYCPDGVSWTAVHKALQLLWMSLSLKQRLTPAGSCLEYTSSSFRMSRIHKDCR